MNHNPPYPMRCLPRYLVFLILMANCRRSTSAANTINILCNDAARGHAIQNTVSIRRGGEASQNLSNQKKPVNLDLSGRLSFLVADQQQQETDEDDMPQTGVKPLFRRRRNNKRNGLLFPSISIGVDYDFGECLYGATHLVSKFAWRLAPRSTHQPVSPTDSGGSNNAPSIRQSIFAALRPRNLEVTTEKGIFKKKDDLSGSVAASWDHGPLFILTSNNNDGVDNEDDDDDEADLVLQSGQHPPISMHIQMNSHNVLALSTTLPVSSRIAWHGKLLGRLVPSAAKGPTNFSIPPPTRDASWMIPEMSINTIGDLQTLNQVWLPPLRSRGAPSNADDNDNLRIGARVMLRRRCAFDFLSSFVGERQDSFTWLGVEVEGLTPRSRTRARVEAALEAPVSSTQVNIFQDLIL